MGTSNVYLNFPNITKKNYRRRFSSIRSSYIYLNGSFFGYADSLRRVTSRKPCFSCLYYAGFSGRYCSYKQSKRKSAHGLSHSSLLYLRRKRRISFLSSPTNHKFSNRFRSKFCDASSKVSRYRNIILLFYKYSRCIRLIYDLLYPTRNSPTAYVNTSLTRWKPSMFLHSS